MLLFDAGFGWVTENGPTAMSGLQTDIKTDIQRDKGADNKKYLQFVYICICIYDICIYVSMLFIILSYATVR